MTSKRSLFAKIRKAALLLGQSERTASRKPRLLASASFADFVRLTPEQNVRAGHSRKARRYAPMDTKRITQALRPSARVSSRPNARASYSVLRRRRRRKRAARAQFATLPPTNESASPRRRSRVRRRESSRRLRISAPPERMFLVIRRTRDGTGVRIRCLSWPSAATAP
jgi:hypothetical protein